MALLNGAATYRKLTTEACFADEPLWRDRLREKVQASAARDPVPTSKETTVGWCVVNARLDTDFTDFNKWLFGDSVVLGLRVTSRKLPAAELAATLEQACLAWRTERDAERVPNSVKKELKERIEDRWLANTIPTSSVYELVWDVGAGTAHFGTLSDLAFDHLRKLFHRSTGQTLTDAAPLDWLDDVLLRDTLLTSAPLTFVGDAP